MNESKIELTERLRREGRWGEASRFKDEALRVSRAKGMTRADATDAAWEATAAAFPLLPADAGPDAPLIAGTPEGEGAGAEWDAGSDDGEEMLGLGTTETPADLIRDII